VAKLAGVTLLGDLGGIFIFTLAGCALLCFVTGGFVPIVFAGVILYFTLYSFSYVQDKTK
jgi:hypothetical protein